jgi:cell pole-organizing protein PopZ
VIEIGRLSATLAKPGGSEVSRAPAPIEPVTGGRATITRPNQEPTMAEIDAKVKADAARERTPMWGGRPH